MTIRYETYDKETRHAAELELLLDRLDECGKISEIGAIAYGGSHAYGLATEGSDVDLRGFALPTARDILRLHDFEQFDTMNGVDATIYSLRKVLGLLEACNPNVIELLGLKDEHILIDSPTFRRIRENRDLFISRKCATTFGGYATQQLRRIQNAMSRDGDDAKRLAESAMRSMNAAIASFPDRYESYGKGQVALRLEDDGEETPTIYADFDFRGMPIHELRGMCGELDDINKNAAQLGKNRRRTKEKISKHGSHLLRLLAMGSEMLETGAVNTYREDDAELLLALKKGLYLSEDDAGIRSYAPEFWELLDAAEKRFQYAKENTELPEEPDHEAIQELMLEEHRRIVTEEA